MIHCFSLSCLCVPCLLILFPLFPLCFLICFHWCPRLFHFSPTVFHCFATFLPHSFLLENCAQYTRDIPGICRYILKNAFLFNTSQIQPLA